MKHITMKTAFLGLSVLVSGLATVACSPENPRLTAPQVKYGVVPQQAAVSVKRTTPKVDILFVIDDSGSMDDEQAALSKNIDKFTESLANQSGIDFHIGAVAIWDTITYKDMKKDYAQGQLRRLKYPDGSPMPEGTEPFVSSQKDYDSELAQKGFKPSKEPGWLQVLRASLKIGTEAYNEKWETEHKGGPNYEEVFSPVKAALSEPMRSGANVGFRRTDAHLVTIFITDADASVRNADGTAFDLSSGELADFLRAELGERYQDEVTAIGVLSRSTDDPKERDPSIRYASKGSTEAVNIQSFIRHFGGRWMGLRDKNYGVALGEMGRYVRSRTLNRPKVDLESIPEWGTIKVRLNGEALEPGDSGWLYDDVRNSIVITRDLQELGRPAQFELEYTQVTSAGLNAGRVSAP